MIQDKYLDVKLMSYTDRPNCIVYQGLHQCVIHESVFYSALDEDKAGEIIVKRLLEGNRGHYSPLELASFVFNVIGYPHDVIGQATRHRTGVSFSIQSFRYTGEFLMSATREDIERYFYLPPVGTLMLDRQGNKKKYTENMRLRDLDFIMIAVLKYQECVLAGVPYEDARRILPAGYRQNFVVGFNARSLLHFCDLRAKANAQTEIQDLAERLFNIFSNYMPEVANWYQKNRMGKAILSP
jgi:thymidylate synthase (FAD)